MPYPTEATVEHHQLIVNRRADESGSLQVPWPIAPLGQFMTLSATLMERTTPYSLLIELARGKVNQAARSRGRLDHGRPADAR